MSTKLIFKPENIYFITLINNMDRFKNVEKIKNDIIPRANIFNAIDANNLSEEQLNHYIKLGYVSEEYINRIKLERKNIGVVGCTLSHILLWKQLLDSDNDYYIICEDDVDIPHDFINEMNKVFEEISNDVDFITFYKHPHFEKKQLVYEKWLIRKGFNLGKKYLFKTVPMYGAVCYFITKNGVRKIFDYLKESKIVTENDTILYHMILFNKFNSFCTYKSIVGTFGPIGKKDSVIRKTKIQSTLW